MDYHTLGTIATAVVALVGLVVWALYVKRNRRDRRRAVGNIVWLGHVLVFGVACLVFDPRHLNPRFEVWSSAVRLHGIIQVTADGLFAVARWYRFQSLVRRATHE
jgi:drug/metabolite transporter (DMT)-like permease